MTYLKKFIINPERIRKVPGSFSWVDREFMRSGYLQVLSAEAILVYFFLLIVGDHQGLSFYGDRHMGRVLKLAGPQLEKARRQLMIQDLIAYQRPMYQVLSLPPGSRAPCSGHPGMLNQKTRSQESWIRSLLKKGCFILGLWKN
jgi:hypothetical protein